MLNMDNNFKFDPFLSIRLQKLLFSEYCDFDDMVLIESPFAQTTKDGRGIRQVHLGLTPSKLVLATDVLPPVEYVNVKYTPGIDPDIETFELIAIYPVECVNLSVYKRKRTQALKARFCNNKVLYFELGGFEKRAMFWNLWCERVKFLCPGDSGSSRSETSVATSTTGSTLYLMDKRVVSANGVKQLWYKFGLNSVFKGTCLPPSIEGSQINKWTDRHLYLGNGFNGNKDYLPVMNRPSKEEFVKSSRNSISTLKHKISRPLSYLEENNLSIGDSVQINRFGSGVYEGCRTALYLTVDDYKLPQRYSQVGVDSITPSISESASFDLEVAAESALLVWEFYNCADPNKYLIRHKRRYGLSTQPMVLYGFGTHPVVSGSRCSLQLQRAVSEVNLLHESTFPTEAFKVQLNSSPSYQHLSSQGSPRPNTLKSAPKPPALYFWTPKFRYRPKPARDYFRERQKHLKLLKDFHESTAKKRNKRKKRCFKRLTGHKCRETDEDSNEEPYPKKPRKKYAFMYMFSSRVEELLDLSANRNPKENHTQFLKRMLKMELSLTIWDFDSSTLAEQLTIIHKELFLKISTEELESLVLCKTSKYAPNLLALLSFSERISCLMASEVLRIDTEKCRARLLARLINVAQKCHKISNFQTCRTILTGLQSPAIYRLKKTWAYVRKRHASKYRTFEFFCRLYRDPRVLAYQKTFYIASLSPPFMPYIGDVIARLLNKVPEYSFNDRSRSVSRKTSYETVESSHLSQCLQCEAAKNSSTLFSKFIQVFHNPEPGKVQTLHSKSTSVKKKILRHRKASKCKGLYEYYKSFEFEGCSIESLVETVEFLGKCHLGATGYNFNVNELAKSYLLKARYQDDKENFIMSLSVEPAVKYYSLDKINKHG